MTRARTLEIFCGVLLLLTLILLLGGYYYRTTLNSGLMTASVRGDLPAVKRLVSRGADVRYRDNVGFTPLYQASHAMQPEVVRWLLARGADPNAADADGWTPLMYAARNGDYVSAKALIEAGADVNAVNRAGETPLVFIRKYSHSRLVANQLRSAGARR